MLVNNDKFQYKNTQNNNYCLKLKSKVGIDGSANKLLQHYYSSIARDTQHAHNR